MINLGLLWVSWPLWVDTIDYGLMKRINSGFFSAAWWLPHDWGPGRCNGFFSHTTWWVFMSRGPVEPTKIMGGFTCVSIFGIICLCSSFVIIISVSLRFVGTVHAMTHYTMVSCRETAWLRNYTAICTCRLKNIYKTPSAPCPWPLHPKWGNLAVSYTRTPASLGTMRTPRCHYTETVLIKWLTCWTIFCFSLFWGFNTLDRWQFMGWAFISCSSISGRDILCLSDGHGVLVTLILQGMGGISFNFISSFIINYRNP